MVGSKIGGCYWKTAVLAVDGLCSKTAVFVINGLH